MADSLTPGQRLKRMAAAELALLGRELGKARAGKDTAVHRARKTLQRLRSLLRLARRVDAAWFRRTDDALSQLRRRLGRLRDAAVRVEHVAAMLDGELPAEQREQVDAALLRLREQLAATWQGLPDGFWDRVETDWTRQLARFDSWPLEQLEARHVDAALERARKRLRVELGLALGRSQRSQRHVLRRHLRRYATMRKAAAMVLRRRDPIAGRLVDVARELGVEGDLWLTALALQKAGQAEATRALRAEMAKRRHSLCRLHDGELVALKHTALAKKPRAGKAKPKRRKGAADSAASAG